MNTENLTSVLLILHLIYSLGRNKPISRVELSCAGKTDHKTMATAFPFCRGFCVAIAIKADWSCQIWKCE